MVSLDEDIPMSGRILIVDDATDLRTYLAKLLRFSGYRVLEAASAAEGLSLLATTDPLPDLVLLDVMMPVMNGIQMLHAMRGDPRTARVPVVMLSAWDDPRQVAAALAEGASDYWIKGDVDVGQMLVDIEQVIAGGSAAVPKSVTEHDPAAMRREDPDPV